MKRSTSNIREMEAETLEQKARTLKTVIWTLVGIIILYVFIVAYVLLIEELPFRTGYALGLLILLIGSFPIYSLYEGIRQEQQRRAKQK